jgi:hypothetical protein
MKLLGVVLTTTALFSAAPAVSVLPAVSSGAACAQSCPPLECDLHGCTEWPFSFCTGIEMWFVEEDHVCAEGQHQGFPICEIS